MRKLILKVHTSLDGYVAGKHGELDGFDAGEENLQFVCKICETADAAMFGRISYEMINGYWPTAKDLPDASKGTVEYSNWYNSAQKIVVSTTMKDEGLEDTIVISKNVADEVRKIKEQPGKDIVLFGAPTLTQYLTDHGLIDEYWVFLNPAIFGQGVPLFRPSTASLKLRLAETKHFENGELALRYVL